MIDSWFSRRCPERRVLANTNVDDGIAVPRYFSKRGVIVMIVMEHSEEKIKANSKNECNGEIMNARKGKEYA